FVRVELVEPHVRQGAQLLFAELLVAIPVSRSQHLWCQRGPCSTAAATTTAAARRRWRIRVDRFGVRRLELADDHAARLDQDELHADAVGNGRLLREQRGASCNDREDE